MKKNFQTFLSQLSETNTLLSSFTDFEKIKNNISKISIKLHQLNYLIGKQDLKVAINELFQENPTVFDVLDILIAVRKNKNAKTINRIGEIVSLNTYFTSPDKIYEFILDTGLAEIFRNNDVSNLVDYVFGVEVGLDTNARKNRGGASMSLAVSQVLDSANIFYKKEVNSSDFSEITSLGTDLKRFDFVIKTSVRTYLIETNYYNGGGSKLNEVARSYTDVGLKINQYSNFEFVWITDGRGWLSAKNKLEEAFLAIPSVYNLSTLPEFVRKVLQENVINF